MLRRASTQARRKSNMSGGCGAEPDEVVDGERRGRELPDRDAPARPSDSGGMIALTREPSGRRASTIGDDSSTRRPIGAMIRSMIRMTWSSFWKTTFVSSSLPDRSM